MNEYHGVNYTYEQLASDYRLWEEYFDGGATMSEDEFNELELDIKIGYLIDAYGAEL